MFFIRVRPHYDLECQYQCCLGGGARVHTSFHACPEQGGHSSLATYAATAVAVVLDDTFNRKFEPVIRVVTPSTLFTSWYFFCRYSMTIYHYCGSSVAHVIRYALHIR